MGVTCYVSTCQHPLLWFYTSVSSFPSMHPSGVPYGDLLENNCKEQLSIAYTHAVATAARCTLDVLRVDHETVDGVIRQKADHEHFEGLQLDVQLKCTAQDVLKDKYAEWRLDVNHYNRLRSERTYNCRVLVVMVVPPVVEQWIDQDEDKMTLLRCAYWISLRGAPETDRGTKVVHVPRKNIFNVEQLLGIFARIGSGGDP